MSKRCGTIAILGEPNVGKSTLVNQLVGGKVSIVSPKVQTTRVNVRGICMHGDAQMVLIDTPGIFTAKKPFEQTLVKAAWAGLKEADMVLLVVDGRIGLTDDTRAIIRRLIPSPLEGEGREGGGTNSNSEYVATPHPLTPSLKGRGNRRICLAINKVDKVKKEKLLELAAALDKEGSFARIFMVSAMKGDGVEDIKSWMASAMPEAEWLFPEDHLSDVPMSQLATEITREKIFYKLSQELPYSIAVEPEGWEEKQDSVRISQCILVQKEGQKKIVLGKGGSMLKQIGMSSRRELEKLLEKKIHLTLFVKVRPNWQEGR